jgi:uncharacterized membrane protein
MAITAVRGFLAHGCDNGGDDRRKSQNRRRPMTSKLILTASVAAIALAVGSFAVTGSAFAKGGSGGHGSHGSSNSSMSYSSSKSSGMKMSSSSHKHHQHHRKRIIVSGGDGDSCDGYIKNGVCYEDDDDED